MSLPSNSFMEKTWFAYVLVVFTTLCWGANAIFAQLAVGELSPMALVTLRWLGVVMLLLVFAHKTVRRDWPNLKPHLVFLSAMGVLGYASFNGLFYIASHSTTAVNIGILQGSIPIFVFIGAFLAYRDRVTGAQIMGVTLAFVGVAIVASGGDLSNLLELSFNFGDILMISACMLYAGYTVGLRKRPNVSAIGMFTVMAGAAFLASIPMAAIEMSMGQFQVPTVNGWAIAAVVTLFPSLLAQLSFIHAVKMIGPGRAAVMVNLAPVFAATMAVLILGEPFRSYHGIALALVLGGIWLSERGKAAS